MTISTTGLRVSYSGNGVTTDFSFPYKFLANGDLVVTLVASDGTETLQVLDTDYTVTGAGTASGAVAMATPPVSGETLLIIRQLELRQEVDYITGGPFPAETHEGALDRLTMIAQQLEYDNIRSIRVSIADQDGTLDTQLPSFVANKGFKVNETGDGITLTEYDIDDAASVAAASATAAQDSAVAAAVSAGEAGASETAALASEVAAASSALAAAAAAANGINFKNLLINGGFDVWQRGTSFTRTVLPGEFGFTADRWNAGFVDLSSGTLSITQSGNAMLITGGSTAHSTNGYECVFQPIEFPLKYSGKTVTVSFDLSSSDSRNIGVYLYASYDSVETNGVLAAESVTTNTTLTRKTVTFVVPDLSTKTFGSNASIHLGFRLSSSNGDISVYSFPWAAIQALGTASVTLTNVQLEEGSVATDFERRPLSVEETLCKRYYQTGKVHTLGFSTGAGQYQSSRVLFTPSMRSVPTMALTQISQSGAVGSQDLTQTTNESTTHYVVSNSGATVLEWAGTYKADAEL